MIKHDLCVLQAPFRLHSHDEACSTTHTINQRLENENLLSYKLTWEATILYVIIVILGFQLKDVINIATTCMMLENNNQVMNVG